MRVLVVDDSRSMRMIVVRTLRKAGFAGLEIVEAANGVEGMACLAKEQFDIVLSDWNMPAMSGLEFLVALRAASNKIPFGFVTSEGAASMRQQATDAGADFLIAKPFTPELFEETLKPFMAVKA